jgi:hypothetical protein
LKTLTDLDLGYNKNLDHGQVLQVVKQLPNLNRLNLTGMPIPEADRDAFKRSLPRCEINF